MRQAALLGVAGLVAVAGTFGAVRAGAAIFAGDDIPPAGPSGDLMDERGSGGTYPCSFDTTPGRLGATCVARGERDGLKWKMGASVQQDGTLCLAIETVGGGAAGGGGSSCNEYEPERIALEQMGIGDLPMLAYGKVPSHVERLVLEHGAAESFELEIYPPPEGFPIEAGYFLVWLPDDAVRLVAYDAEGGVVTTQSFDGSQPGSQPEETARAEIGDVVHDGSPWKVEAYGAVEDGRDVVCVRMELRGAETSALAPCDASFGRQSVVGVSAFSSPEFPQVVAFGGVTSSKTGSVTFVAGDGLRVDALMIEPPAKVDRTLRFFTAFLPAEGAGTKGSIVVRNLEGDVIEERDYCVPGGDGLSC